MTATEPVPRTSRAGHARPGAVRSVLHVAVLDASERAGLVCVRSLGRAGLRVGAFAAWAAPAFRSRWASATGSLPDYAQGADAFVDAVLDLVERRRPKVVI